MSLARESERRAGPMSGAPSLIHPPFFAASRYSCAGNGSIVFALTGTCTSSR